MPKEEEKSNWFDLLLRWTTNIFIIIFLLSMIISINKSMPKSQDFNILIDKNVPHPDQIPGLYNQKKQFFRYTKLFKEFYRYDKLNIRIPKGILLTGPQEVENISYQIHSCT